MLEIQVVVTAQCPVGKKGQVRNPVEVGVTAVVHREPEDDMIYPGVYSGASSSSTSSGPRPWRAEGNSHSSLVQARRRYWKPEIAI